VSVKATSPQSRRALEEVSGRYDMFSITFYHKPYSDQACKNSVGGVNEWMTGVVAQSLVRAFASCPLHRPADSLPYFEVGFSDPGL
jgi:hypothetical protein